jgi:hypothetical protein
MMNAEILRKLSNLSEQDLELVADLVQQLSLTFLSKSAWLDLVSYFLPRVLVAFAAGAFLNGLPGGCSEFPVLEAKPDTNF